jgi:hypothetical protein
MASPKTVMWTLTELWESAYAFVFPVSVKNIPAAREYLVTISLMPYIPDYFIPGVLKT